MEFSAKSAHHKSLKIAPVKFVRDGALSCAASRRDETSEQRGRLFSTLLILVVVDVSPPLLTLLEIVQREIVPGHSEASVNTVTGNVELAERVKRNRGGQTVRQAGVRERKERGRKRRTELRIGERVWKRREKPLTLGKSRFD